MVHLFDLAGTTADWPMGGANPQRTGFLAADCPEPRTAPPAIATVGLSVFGLPGAGSRAILLQLPEEAEVRLELFDVQGRRIVRLLDERLPAGAREVPWDGQNEAGVPVEAGVYFLRATIGETTTATRFVVVR